MLTYVGKVNIYIKTWCMLPYVGKSIYIKTWCMLTYVGKVNIYQDVVYVTLCR